MKYRSIFLSLFCLIVLATWIGFLISIANGLIYTIYTALVLILVVSKWGEKIVLIFSKARYVTDDEQLVNQVKNFCIHLGIKEIKLYWSRDYSNNVYVADSFWGRPVLVIGKATMTYLSRNELNSVIYAQLLKIKTKEALNNSFLAISLFILFLPLFIVLSFLSENLKRKWAVFYYYPLVLIQKKMNSTSKLQTSHDLNVSKQSGMRTDYISALFKLSQKYNKIDYSIASILLSQLGIVANKSEDVLADSLLGEADITSRISSLK